MKRIFIAIILILTVFSAWSITKFEKHLSNAKAYYESGEFDKVIDELSEALGIAKKSNQKGMIEAYQYLAFSYVAYDENDKAENLFSEILKLYPEFDLDHDTISPKIIVVFEKARAKFKAQKKKKTKTDKKKIDTAKKEDTKSFGSKKEKFKSNNLYSFGSKKEKSENKGQSSKKEDNSGQSKKEDKGKKGKKDNYGQSKKEDKEKKEKKDNYGQSKKEDKEKKEKKDNYGQSKKEDKEKKEKKDNYGQEVSEEMHKRNKERKKEKEKEKYVRKTGSQTKTIISSGSSYGTGGFIGGGRSSASRFGAVWRSALCPGWGQIYKGETTKGWIFIGTILVLDIADLVTMGAAQSAYDDYEAAANTTRQEFDDAWDTYEKKYKTYSMVALTHILFWSYNMTDVTFFGWKNFNISLRYNKKDGKLLVLEKRF